MIFKGKNQDSSFKVIYNANTAELDEYTDTDGKIKQISQQAKFLLEYEKQHMYLKPAERQNKSEQQRLKEICDSVIDNMVTNHVVYYIGNKQNIIEILAGIYYKIKQYSTIPQRKIDAHPELIIKLAIERMYYQMNDNDIRKLRARDLPDAKYSSDLIEAVKAIVVDYPENEETYNLPEYQLTAIPRG